MKFFIVFAVALATVYGALDAEFKEKAMEVLQQVGAECVMQENASNDDIAQLVGKHIPTSKEGKCVMACFNEKFGVQDADGKLDADAAKKSIEPFKAADETIYNKMTQVIDKCFPEVGDTGDRCENAVQVAMCAKKFGEEIGLIEDIIM